MRPRAMGWSFALTLAALGALRASQEGTVTAERAHRAGMCGLAASHDAWAVAWIERDSDRPDAVAHAAFATLSPDGRRGAIARIDVPAHTLTEVALASDGEGWAVVVLAYNRRERAPRYEVHFASFDRAGRPRAGPLRVSGAASLSFQPRVAWRDGAYTVAWVSPVTDAGVWRARVAPDGRVVTEAARVHDEAALQLALVAQGGRDALAWVSPRGPGEASTVRWLWPAEGSLPRREASLTRTRDAVGSLHAVAAPEGVDAFWVRHEVDVTMALEHAATSPDSARPVFAEVHRDAFVSAVSGARGEGETLLAWTAFEGRASGVAMAPFRGGALAGRPRWFGSPGSFAGAPRVASGRWGYALCWLDGRDGGARVYFGRASREGERVGAAVPVSA